MSSNLETKLDEYVDLLSRYEQANVVGSRDPEKLLLEHVLDSLSCFLFPPLGHAESLADVGSGAGLPGIPIKIAMPSIRTTLIESVGKKANFLRGTVHHLGLENVQVSNQRVEDLAADKGHRESYDLVTARAIAALPVVAEYCVPLVREGGYVVAMKGSPSKKELADGAQAASIVGARLDDIIDVPILSGIRATERRLVILQKVRATPPKYPRRPGVARKHPLGTI